MTTPSLKSSGGKSQQKKLDHCTAYARSVVDGEIVAGNLVKLACQRHLDDQENGEARGLHFDSDKAQTAYDFFGLLHHSKGQWAGQPFFLEPCEHFILGSLFGWRRSDGARRFKTAHVEVARKNFKTTFAAALGLGLMVIDGEPGAEVYSVATKRDQAKLAHDEAKRMVRSSPALKKYLTTFRDALIFERMDGKYVPLGADSDSLDGLNVHGAICDELHAWKYRELWDVIETATGARRQPLMFAITTAGVGRDNIWWERRDLAVKMLNGLTLDDSLFAAIYTLDDDDDWVDETVWIKSNPLLGVTVRIEDLRDRCREAIETPGKQNAFKRLRLNIPTQQVELWFDLDRWDKCNVPINREALKGRSCYGGLDLSATTDMTALVWVFPPEETDGIWQVLPRFWLPGDNLIERGRRDHADYDLWRQQGFLDVTEGDCVDYNAIEAAVLKDADDFYVRGLAVDRWNANQLVSRLKDVHALPVEGYGQGFASMSGPSRELELLVAAVRLAHGGHPVLRFNVSCASCRVDPAGNRKPDKAMSTGRIDGLVATIMALGLGIKAEDPTFTVIV